MTRSFSQGDIINNPHLHLDHARHRWVLNNPTTEEMAGRDKPFAALLHPGHPIHALAHDLYNAKADGMRRDMEDPNFQDDMSATPEEAEKHVAAHRPDPTSPVLIESDYGLSTGPKLHVKLNGGRVATAIYRVDGTVADADGHSRLDQVHTDNTSAKPEVDVNTHARHRPLHVAIENGVREKEGVRLLGDFPKGENDFPISPAALWRVSHLGPPERRAFDHYFYQLRQLYPEPQVEENLFALEAHLLGVVDKHVRSPDDKDLYPGWNKEPHTTWDAVKGKPEKWAAKVEAEIGKGQAAALKRHGFSWDRTSSLYLPDHMPEGPVGEMWHGTSAAVGDAIAQNGFAVPEKAPHGRALGDGVYLSHQFEKSVQYPFSNPDGSKFREGETSMLRVAYPLDAMPHIGNPRQLMAYLKRIEDEPALKGHHDRLLAAYHGRESSTGPLRELLQPGDRERDALHERGIKGFSLPPRFTYLHGPAPRQLNMHNDLVRAMAAHAVGMGLLGAEFDPSEVYTHDRVEKRNHFGMPELTRRTPAKIAKADPYFTNMHLANHIGPRRPLGGFIGQEAIWHGDPSELRVVGHFKGVRKNV